MNDEFYKDVASRLPVYALYSQLQIQIEKKALTLSSYHLDTPDSRSWFVFMVMCFLMRRTLEMPEYDGCTLDEISWQIQEIIKTQYEFVLNPEECYQLARVVVIDILSNGGSAIVFETGTIDNPQVPLSFISSPSIVRAGIRQGGYRMSQDGFRILLGTREVEENLQSNISALIMSLQVKAKNYKGALEQARDEIDRLRIHENSIRDMIARLKADVLFMPMEKAQIFFDENIQIYEDARVRFQDIRKTVQLQMQDLEAGALEGLQDEKMNENLELMNRIDASLVYAVQVTGMIIAALQEFIRTQRNEFITQMGVSKIRKYSIRKDVYEPFMKNPENLEALMDLLHPLFVKDPDPIFNLDRVFHIKDLHQAQEQEAEEYNEELLDETALEMEEQRRQQVSRMHEITFQLLETLLAKPSHTLDLQTFFLQTPDLCQAYGDILKELLAAWCSQQKIDLQKLFAQESELDFTSLDTLYSLPLSVLDASRQNLDLHPFQTLFIQKAEGTVRFPLRDGNLSYVLETDNISLTLERKSL